MSLSEYEQTPSDYIRENYDPDDRLAIFLINRNDGKNFQHLRTAQQITSPAYMAFLDDMNRNNATDVFISMSSLIPNSAGRRKEHVQEVRHVFLDVDERGEDIAEQILKDRTMPTPHHILESSPGKRQIIWSVTEFTIPEAEQLMRGMAHKFGTDTQVWDVARVLRLPGFINNKYPELQHVVKDVAVFGADKREYAPHNFPKFEQSVYQSREPAERTRPQILTVKGGKVDRSAQDWGWVMHKLERGESPTAVKMELEARRPDKPRPAYYAETTVDKAYALFQQSNRVTDRELGNDRGRGQSAGVER